jgi:hypothetical protein
VHEVEKEKRASRLKHQAARFLEERDFIAVLLAVCGLLLIPIQRMPESDDGTFEMGSMFQVNNQLEE